MTSSPIRITDARAGGDFTSLAELVSSPVIVCVDELAEILAKVEAARAAAQRAEIHVGLSDEALGTLAVRSAARIGAVIGRYLTAGGAYVEVTTTGPDVTTAAPGWVAACSGCGWTDDQFACWHELWPTYPNIAGSDVRGLLLDNAQEHADTCEVTR